MKKIFILSLLILCCNLLFSQEFMGVKVDGKLNDVVLKFKAKGFVSQKNDIPDIAVMQGNTGSKEVQIIIISTPLSNTVWKFSVYLPKRTSWYYLKSDYEEYVDLISQKYGQPTKDFNFFVSPYFEGDGYEMTAVAIDKCRYSTFWLDKGLSVQISSVGSINISYENNVNADLDDIERKKIESKVF
jgi:hypothetical protein